MIPKRPKHKAAYYRSREYKKILRLKFYKWNHKKAAKIYFTMFAAEVGALDWLDKGRTRVMQKRADAMFDSMVTMLKIRMDQVPDDIKMKARDEALQKYKY